MLCDILELAVKTIVELQTENSKLSAQIEGEVVAPIKFVNININI